MTRPAVDVVVLTWNDGDRLRIAVASALESTGVDVRVQVVDNGSELPLALPDTGAVEVVRNEQNRGVAPGRNQGVHLGTASYVCFLDSDARLHPDCLAKLSEPLESNSDVGLAAPVFTDQAPEASAGRAPSLGRKVRRVLNLTDSYASARVEGQPWWDVDFAIGACQLFRRAVFDEVDGLDESYFYGPEDVDFCLRIREHGWRVVQVAAARCDHPPRRRNRRLLTRRGLRHAWAVSRHLWRHRAFRRRVAR